MLANFEPQRNIENVGYHTDAFFFPVVSDEDAKKSFMRKLLKILILLLPLIF